MSKATTWVCVIVFFIAAIAIRILKVENKGLRSINEGLETTVLRQQERIDSLELYSKEVGVIMLWEEIDKRDQVIDTQSSQIKFLLEHE